MEYFKSNTVTDILYISPEGKLLQEKWKDVINFEGEYQISDLGRVKSFKTKNFKLLKSYIDNKGYLSVSLRKNSPCTWKLHRLVALHFIVIEFSNDKLEVNHKDGNKLNPCYWNLEWCTHKENMIHAYQNGLMKCKKRERSLKIIKQKENISIENLHNEIWVYIKNYEEMYSISNKGRIKSHPRLRHTPDGNFYLTSERLLNTKSKNNKSAIVSLCKGDKKTSKSLYSLMLNHFPNLINTNVAAS